MKNDKVKKKEKKKNEDKNKINVNGQTGTLLKDECKRQK